MEDNFVKIDLHIHTQKSNCYKGPREDNEILNILRKAKQKELKIIALTDHNSIEGYKLMLKLKGELSHEIDSLSKISDSEQAKERVAIIKDDMALFDDILILPGIEFEVRNGIHLLIIFNNNTRIEDIEEFLFNGGIRPQNFGEEEPSTQSLWDIFALYEQSEKYDCIVIDAHTDSDKGILNTIPKGSTRAKCFRSPQLAAVCYKNEEQKEKLLSTLQTAKEYKRNIPLSFVKFSDAHIADSVGSEVTWVNVDNITFESLKNAFTNPSEMVSTVEPSTAKILDNLIKLDNSFGIPIIDDKAEKYVERLICALNNSDGGYILFGLTQTKNRVGIPLQDIRQIHNEPSPLTTRLTHCFSNISGVSPPKITLYELQKNRIILSIFITKGKSLSNIKGDGSIYAIREGSVKVLTAAETELLIEEKVVKNVETKIIRYLTAVENDCNLIKHLFSSLPIIRAFENNSVRARFSPIISEPISLDSESIQKLGRMFVNGTSKGNLYFFREAQVPRLKNTYLRYSLPVFMLYNVGLKSQKKETIYIVPGGGVYYSRNDCPFFSERYPMIIKIQKLHDNTSYNMKFITCYLKSSFFLWYLKCNYDDIDFFPARIFNTLLLPKINIKRPDHNNLLTNISNSFDQIISLERQYLIEVHKTKQDEKKLELIAQHNSNVNSIAYDIDKLIYKLIGLSNTDIDAIESNLKLNEIFLPSV